MRTYLIITALLLSFVRGAAQMPDAARLQKVLAALVTEAPTGFGGFRDKVIPGGYSATLTLPGTSANKIDADEEQTFAIFQATIAVKKSVKEIEILEREWIALLQNALPGYELRKVIDPITAAVATQFSSPDSNPVRIVLHNHFADNNSSLRLHIRPERLMPRPVAAQQPALVKP